MTDRRPTHPGTILREMYLRPAGVSVAAFADAAGVSRKHASGLVNGRVRVTPEFALRIAIVLGTSAKFWLNLQSAVDIYDVRKRKRRPHAVGV